MLSDPGYDASNQYRNSLAKYVLPSFNEWYKAAYYDPNKPAGGYWIYPTGSDTAPTLVPVLWTTGPKPLRTLDPSHELLPRLRLYRSEAGLKPAVHAFHRWQ